MEIDGSLFQITMPQQNLNGSQIRTVFEQMCGKTMPKCVGMDFLVETGTLRGCSTGNPDDLGRNRMIGGVPAVAGEYPDGWFTPQAAPVFAQGCEQILAEHNITILPALTTLHVDDAPRTIDVGDLQANQFGASETGGIKCHEQGALKRRGGGFDETVDLLPAENGRQMEHLLRVRGKVRTPRLLQRPDVEEADSAEMLDNGVGVILPFAEQICLVLADVIRSKLVGTTVEVARKLVNGSEISADGAGSVISTLEFLEHHLSKMGHRDLLVTAPYRDSCHTRQSMPMNAHAKRLPLRLRSSRLLFL